MINDFCCRARQFVINQNGIATCGSCAFGCSTCTSEAYCTACDQYWMLGINNRCYNSTESMLAGEYSGV